MNDKKRRAIREAIRTTDLRLPQITFWWLVALKAELTMFEMLSLMAHDAGMIDSPRVH